MQVCPDCDGEGRVPNPERGGTVLCQRCKGDTVVDEQFEEMQKVLDHTRKRVDRALEDLVRERSRKEQATRRVGELREALDEILNYDGGADSPLEDPYVMGGVKAAARYEAWKV